MKVRFAGQDCAGPLPVSPGERGLLLGDGVFETILALNGRPVWLSDHLDRLLAAVSVLGLKAARPELEREVRAVIGPEPGVIRLTVMRGDGPRGLAAGGQSGTPVLASFSPLSAGTIRAPVRLAVSAVRRNEGSPASRLKTLSYLDNILAAREAVSRGADCALMLNNTGHVACVSTGNIFAVSGSKLLTPPGSEGVLAGIARKHILECALRLGLAPAEEPLRVEDLTAADEVFMTNSLRLVSPVTELDGFPLKRTADAVVERLFSVLCKSVVSETSYDPRSLAAPGI
jgi:branched-chain amino acid aminotransferase